MRHVQHVKQKNFVVSVSFFFYNDYFFRNYDSQYSEVNSLNIIFGGIS